MTDNPVQGQLPQREKFMINKTLSYVISEKAIGQRNGGETGDVITFSTEGNPIEFEFKESPFEDGTTTFTISASAPRSFALKLVTKPTNFPYANKADGDTQQGVIGTGDIDVVPPGS